MREGTPPGAAYRVFERLPNGSRRFIGIAFLMASTPEEVRIRWAGLETAGTIPRRVWDNWHVEFKENFPPLLWPKET